jgi:hypothetical protein
MTMKIKYEEAVTVTDKIGNLAQGLLFVRPGIANPNVYMVLNLSKDPNVINAFNLTKRQTERFDDCERVILVEGDLSVRTAQRLHPHTRMIDDEDEEEEDYGCGDADPRYCTCKREGSCPYCEDNEDNEDDKDTHDWANHEYTVSLVTEVDAVDPSDAAIKASNLFRNTTAIHFNVKGSDGDEYGVTLNPREVGKPVEKSPINKDIHPEAKDKKVKS